MAEPTALITSSTPSIPGYYDNKTHAQQYETQVPRQYGGNTWAWPSYDNNIPPNNEAQFRHPYDNNISPYTDVGNRAAYGLQYRTGDNRRYRPNANNAPDRMSHFISSGQAAMKPFRGFVQQGHYRK